MLQLVDQRETTATTLEELKDLSYNDYRMDTAFVPFNSIRLEDDGLFILKDRPATAVTRLGFKNFCSSIGIPNPFATKIPFDLLQHNIHRLLKLTPEKLVMVVTRPDGNIVNITKPNKKRLQNDIMADGLLELQDEHLSNIKSIRVSDSFTQLSVVNSLEKLEPIVGDITEIGLDIRWSNAAAFKHMAQMFLYRLECSNGAVAPYEHGYYTGNTEASFLRNIGNASFNVTDITTVYNEMPNFRVKYNDVVKFHKHVANLTSIEMADTVFELDEEARKEIFKEESLRLKTIDPKTLEDFSYYDLYNSITYNAKSEGVLAGGNMEILGGKVISHFASTINVN